MELGEVGRVLKTDQSLGNETGNILSRKFSNNVLYLAPPPPSQCLICFKDDTRAKFHDEQIKFRNKSWVNVPPLCIWMLPNKSLSCCHGAGPALNPEIARPLSLKYLSVYQGRQVINKQWQHRAISFTCLEPSIICLGLKLQETGIWAVLRMNHILHHLTYLAIEMTCLSWIFFEFLVPVLSCDFCASAYVSEGRAGN